MSVLLGFICAFLGFLCGCNFTHAWIRHKIEKDKL